MRFSPSRCASLGKFAAAETAFDHECYSVPLAERSHTSADFHKGLQQYESIVLSWRNVQPSKNLSVKAKHIPAAVIDEGSGQLRSTATELEQRGGKGEAQTAAIR